MEKNKIAPLFATGL